MGKGSQTTTSQTSADPQAASLYRDLLNRAQGVASTPYQSYTGDLVAGVNSQQQAGINNINANAGFATPYIQQAAGLATNAGNPLTAEQISNYQNPYQQQVIDATIASANQNNAQQQAQLRGNQIASGALGGNRAGVAQANLAAQQSTALNNQIAGLNSAGYQQALQTAQQQYQQNPLAAAYGLAGFGVQGQNAALSGAQAQIGAGTLQQQTQQALNTANYGQFQQAQAYPYQQLQWLAGLGTGVGSQLGGTSSSTAPQPSPWGQIAGLGLTAASLLSDRNAKESISKIGEMHDGTPLYRYRYKGSDEWHVGPMAQDIEKRTPGAVERGADGYRYVDLKEATDNSVRGFAVGGGVPSTPWGDAHGWIPTIQLAGGRGAPSAPSGSGDRGGGGTDWAKQAQGLLGLADGVRGRFSSEAYGGGSIFDGDESAYGGSSRSPLAGLDASDYGPGFARGGPIRGFAAGGMPLDPEWVSDGGFNRLDAELDRPAGPVPGADMMFEDRVAPARAAIETGAFDPQGANYSPFAPTSEAMEASNRGLVPIPRERPAGAPVVARDDGDDVPVAAAPVRGFAAPAAAVPAAANSNVPMARASGDHSTGVSGFGLFDLSPAARTGLLAAGLGMLASRASNFGNQIGEGGLHGLGAYQGVKTAEAKQEMDNRKLDQQAQQLAQSAQRAAEDLRLRSASQQETARHNRVSEANAAEGKVPFGMFRDKDGFIKPVPGYVETVGEIARAKKPAGELMDDETAQMLADRVRAGDTRALIGLGRGAQGAENIAKIQGIVARDAAKGAPVNPAAQSILSNAATHAGRLTAERTQAGIMAKLSVYGRTAFNATDIAERLSEQVPRTEFQPVNKILNAARTNTGDPKIVALGQALMTLTNEYARAIGGGHGTVHDKEAAEKRLSAAQSHEQLKAVIDVMRQEITAEERAMPEARKHMTDIYSPGGDGTSKRSVAGSHAVSSPPAAFVPPADAIPRTYQGKTYYYDPVTKKPYPGQ